MDLLRNKFEGLNDRRLYELMRFINARFAKLPSSQNVENKLSSVRQIVKDKLGDGVRYKKSQIHLVFDPIQKHKNIVEYNRKVFNETKITSQSK